MLHPAKEAKEPTGPPCYSTGEFLVWFYQKRICFRGSNGRFEDVCLLDVCPVTGNLMYLQPYYPIVWTLIDEESMPELYESYMRHLLEKDMLGENPFEQESTET